MSPNRNAARLPYVILVIATAIWGVTWPIGKVLSAGLPSDSLAAARYTIAVPILFLLLFAKERSLALRKEWVVPLFLLGLFSTSLYQFCYLYSLKLTAASDASIIVGTEPIMITVLASSFLTERLSVQQILGLTLGFTGVVLIATQSPNSEGGGSLLGDAIVLMAALSYSVYTVYLRRCQLLWGSKSPSPTYITTWMSFFGWISMLPFAYLERPWTYSWTVDNWFEIAYLGVGATVVGYLLFATAVSMIGASRAGVALNLTPVIGVLSSAVLLSETLNWVHALSISLIVSAVWISSRKRIIDLAEAARVPLHAVKRRIFRRGEQWCFTWGPPE